MLKSKRNFRLGVCGVLLCAVYFGFASSAIAWNEPLWVRQFGNEGEYDSGTGVATDAVGNVYVSGWSALYHEDGASEYAWLAKYDAAGRVLWKRQLGTEEQYDSGTGVATDAVGNVYVSGWSADYDQSPGAWLAKYDAAGRVLWKRQFEGGSATGVATDAVGNVYVSGWTYRLLGGFYSGLGDAWVAKYDAAGHMLWKRELGTESSFDSALGVATDTAGNVYLTGWTTGSLGGANRGDSDAWVAKYSARR